MLPIQEIRVKTEKNWLFAVDIEKHQGNIFKSSIAYIEGFHGSDGIYERYPSEESSSAKECFQKVIGTVSINLEKQGNPIVEIDNICNTELLSVEAQKNILGAEVLIRVNGEAI